MKKAISQDKLLMTYRCLSVYKHEFDIAVVLNKNEQWRSKLLPRQKHPNHEMSPLTNPVESLASTRHAHNASIPPILPTKPVSTILPSHTHFHALSDAARWLPDLRSMSGLRRVFDFPRPCALRRVARPPMLMTTPPMEHFAVGSEYVCGCFCFLTWIQRVSIYAPHISGFCHQNKANCTHCVKIRISDQSERWVNLNTGP